MGHRTNPNTNLNPSKNRKLNPVQAPNNPIQTQKMPTQTNQKKMETGKTSAANSPPPPPQAKKNEEKEERKPYQTQVTAQANARNT